SSAFPHFGPLYQFTQPRSRSIRAAISRVRSFCVFSMTWMITLSAASVYSRARLSSPEEGARVSIVRRNLFSPPIPVAVHCVALAIGVVVRLDLVIVDVDDPAPVVDLLPRLGHVHNFVCQLARR